MEREKITDNTSSTVGYLVVRRRQMLFVVVRIVTMKGSPASFPKTWFDFHERLSVSI